MSIKRILEDHNNDDLEILMKESNPVDFSFPNDDIGVIKAGFLGVLEDMRDTLDINKNGIGLAANQIGILKRIFLVQYDGKTRTFINPKIVRKLGRSIQSKESCLSRPGKSEIVTRNTSVLLTWQTKEGKSKSRTFKGFTAIIIQHEMDHLNGILI